MEEVDKEALIIEQCLELAKLKQGGLVQATNYWRLLPLQRPVG